MNHSAARAHEARKVIPVGNFRGNGRAAMTAKIQGVSICLTLVPGEGIEPTRCHHHRILSPARLPVPPSGHASRASIIDAAMRRADFHFELPRELIAQEPAPVRSASRLLALNGASGACRDLGFKDLPALLSP